MASTQLPPDFKEFLRLLNANGVEYLLIGGYAVGYYGYPRYTGDIDIWVRRSPENAESLVRVLIAFGFNVPELSSEIFLKEHQVTRMGYAPIRIEILTTISGVDFDTCFAAKHVATLDGINIPIISLDHLMINKRASDRHKDLEDLVHLERLRRRKP